MPTPVESVLMHCLLLLLLFPRLYIRKNSATNPPRSHACATCADAALSKNARLLELLLDAELVRVAALLLAAVGGLGVKAGIAPAKGHLSQQLHRDESL
jgi:hypothetical protein